MKKIITIMLFTVAFNSNAFWNGNNNNNYPWNNFGGNNAPWNSVNNFVEDNGIFGFNPYEYTNPQWYPQEMSNMLDEFDDEFGGNNWGNKSNFSNSYNQYNPYNKGNPNPYNNFNNNPNKANNPYLK
jgi:hypothetical protein